MTIGLSYNNDLSRVQVALSDLPDGTVRLERSPSGLLWETVRAGDELEVSAGVANLDDFEFYADILNHYRAVPIDPPAGLLLAGVVGDYASTPDTAVLDIAGNFRISAEATLTEWGSTNQALAAKFVDPGQRSHLFRVRPDGHLFLTVSTDGVNGLTFDSGAVVPFATGERGAVRAQIDFDIGGGVSRTNFYTAPSIIGPWTLLGTADRTDASAGPFSSTAPLEVGSWNGGTQHLLNGTVHAVVLEDSIGGTVVANPDFAAQTGGAGSFTDDSGLLWTINGNAEIVGIQSDTITPDLLGEVWLKSIRYPLLNRPVLVQAWTPGGRPFRGTIDEVQGRSLPSSTSDLRGSKRFEIDIATRDIIDQSHDGVAEAGALDIIFAVETDFLIHVPASRSVPGGHVAIVANLDESRIVPKGDRAPRMFRLQCTRVAAPDASVRPTTLVIGTILNQFGGDIAAVLAAHPTLATLLATVGSPDDLVVI